MRSSETYSGIHNLQRSGYPLQLKNCKDDQNEDLSAVFCAFILVHHLGWCVLCTDEINAYRLNFHFVNCRNSVLCLHPWKHVVQSYLLFWSGCGGQVQFCQGKYVILPTCSDFLHSFSSGFFLAAGIKIHKDPPCFISKSSARQIRHLADLPN